MTEQKDIHEVSTVPDHQVHAAQWDTSKEDEERAIAKPLVRYSNRVLLDALSDWKTKISGIEGTPLDVFYSYMSPAEAKSALRNYEVKYETLHSDVKGFMPELSLLVDALLRSTGLQQSGNTVGKSLWSITDQGQAAGARMPNIYFDDELVTDNGETCPAGDEADDINSRLGKSVFPAFLSGALRDRLAKEVKGASDPDTLLERGWEIIEQGCHHSNENIQKFAQALREELVRHEVKEQRKEVKREVDKASTLSSPLLRQR